MGEVKINPQGMGGPNSPTIATSEFKVTRGQSRGLEMGQKSIRNEPQVLKPSRVNITPGAQSGFVVKIPEIKDYQDNIFFTNPQDRSLGYISRVELETQKPRDKLTEVAFKSFTNVDDTNPNDEGYITYKDGKPISVTYTLSDKSRVGFPKTFPIDLEEKVTDGELNQQLLRGIPDDLNGLYSFEVKEGTLKINPGDLTRSRSVSISRNRNGGFDINVPDATFNSFAWEKASLRQVIASSGDAREQALNLRKLQTEGYDVDVVRSVLKWEASNGDSGYFVLSKDSTRKGIVSICEKGGVSFGDMEGPQQGPFLARKPVIYLYPRTEIKVEVAVGLPEDAAFSSLYPKMNDGKWVVLANPDGELRDHKSDKNYSYLFWEAEQETPFVIQREKAYCVSGNDSEEFLEKTLRKLGLSAKESNDFIVYWLPILEKNRYNIIQFMDEDYTDRYPLKVSPKPETSIRVFMVFEKSVHKVETGTPTINEVPRSGFTLVEWGGCNLDEVNGQILR